MSLPSSGRKEECHLQRWEGLPWNPGCRFYLACLQVQQEVRFWFPTRKRFLPIRAGDINVSGFWGAELFITGLCVEPFLCPSCCAETHNREGLQLMEFTWPSSTNTLLGPSLNILILNNLILAQSQSLCPLLFQLLFQDSSIPYSQVPCQHLQADDICPGRIRFGYIEETTPKSQWLSHEKCHSLSC